MWQAIRSIDPDHPLAKLIEKGRQANAIKQYQLMAEAVYNYYQQEGELGLLVMVERIILASILFSLVI